MSNPTITLPQAETKPVAAAKMYAAHGWHVFPCHFPVDDAGACSCGEDCGDRCGKHPFAGIQPTGNGQKFKPFAPKGHKDATLSKQKIVRWWKAVPQLNVAVAMGPRSGLVAIDVDPQHGGMESLAQLQRDTGVHLTNKRATLTGRTGSDGIHLIFEYKGDDIQNMQAMLPGIDVRGEGGYIMVAPSSNRNGVYAWINDMPPQPLPDELRVRLLAAQEASTKRKGDWIIPEKVEHGTIHDFCLAYGGALRTWGLTVDELEKFFHLMSERFEVKPTDQELRQWAESLGRYEVRPDRSPMAMLRKVQAERAEFGMPAPPAHNQTTIFAAGEHDKAETLFKTLPDDVFGLLPDELANICALLQTDTSQDALHRRDLFLTGALPVIATCMPNTFVRYGGKWKGINLYMNIICEAGGGKSRIQLAQRLGEDLDDLLLARSQAAAVTWENIRQSAPEQADANPPPYKRVFFGGDAAGRSLKDALYDNQTLCMFETEFSTVVQSLKMEWGGFRDVLLKAFEAERVQIERTGQPPKVVKRPGLSLCLTGTPRSFEEFIADTEDGAFSRCCFYYFEGSDQWESQFGDGDEDLQTDLLVEQLAEQLPNLHAALISRDSPLFITMDKEDQVRHDALGEAAMNRLLASNSDRNLKANVKRAGLIAFRIAAILSLFRIWRSGGDLFAAKSIKCRSADVTAGWKLALSYLEHALRLSEVMAQGGHDKLKSTRLQLLDSLPTGPFGIQDAYKLAPRLHISQRTLYNYLNDLVAQKLLTKQGKDGWHKPERGTNLSAVPSFTSLIEITGSEDSPDAVD